MGGQGDSERLHKYFVVHSYQFEPLKLARLVTGRSELMGEGREPGIIKSPIPNCTSPTHKGGQKQGDIRLYRRSMRVAGALQGIPFVVLNYKWNLLGDLAFLDIERPVQ